MSAKARATVTVQERDYSVEEVGEVIRTASALAHTGEGALTTAPRDTLAFGELSELARELGIPQESLLLAIPEADERRKRALKRTKKKMRFWRHLFVYLPVMTGLGVIDFLAGNGLNRATFVIAAFWGIFLAMHGLRAYVTGPEGALHRSVLRGELESEQRGR